MIMIRFAEYNVMFILNLIWNLYDRLYSHKKATLNIDIYHTNIKLIISEQI